VRLYEARVRENAKQNIAATNSKLNNIAEKYFFAFCTTMAEIFKLNTFKQKYNK
jgi:hypothetical protein